MTPKEKLKLAQILGIDPTEFDKTPDKIPIEIKLFIAIWIAVMGICGGRIIYVFDVYPVNPSIEGLIMYPLFGMFVASILLILELVSYRECKTGFFSLWHRIWLDLFYRKTLIGSLWAIE
ncbi:hypothetical protein [Phyllobacterium sp. LjRoot231]|uniref:hypothetical protein n=1 Tax=Phyllobacterium sp. LjRoot231 TaxID=3342289 RepID=UPI003F4F9202